MKPPICELCGDRFDPADGDLVTFVGDERSRAWHRRVHDEGITGHPPDQGWFCAEHAEAVRPLSGSRTLAASLREIRGHSAGQSVAAGDPGVDVDATERRSELRRHVASRRDTPITPREVSSVARLLDEAFADMLAVLVGLDATLDQVPPVSVSRKVEVLDSPEWREPDPAAEETIVVRTVTAAGWMLVRDHRRLEWYSGGLGRASESISMSPVDRGSTFDRAMLLMASMPVGDRVTEVSITGEVPEFVQSVVDDLIDALSSPADAGA